jgi:hypothetical protein
MVGQDGTTVHINALQSLTPDQIRVSMDGFRDTYVRDWDEWLATPAERRPELFGRILRKWQATRPHEMRRARVDAKHSPPYLDDLLETASEPITLLGGLGLSWMNLRTPAQTDALAKLWEIFSALQIADGASCVGISKAVLLATNGRIGPALDSEVRQQLRIQPPKTAGEWLDVLDAVGSDIRAFEREHGPLYRLVPQAFSKLEDGRMYDMVFGPKGRA